MSNLVRRINKNDNHNQAVQDMIETMQYNNYTFKCSGKIASNRSYGYGASVKMSYVVDGKTWTGNAYLYKNNTEYVCIPDVYNDEGSDFKGTEGNWYHTDGDKIYASAF